MLEATLEEALAQQRAVGASGALALAVGPWGRLRASVGVDASGRPLRPTAPFAAASVTKTFVAALVLLLVEDDLIGLDEDVVPRLPRSFELTAPVNLRSLLNHTSGLPDYFEDAGFLTAWRQNPGREWDPHQLVEISLALPPREPGIFRYANVNYVLVGLVIEALSGRTVGDLLRERVLQPLGLTGTQLPGTASAAAGGLVAPADDIARFLAALLSGEIVNSGSLREILSTVRSDWPESQGYGLGIEQVESLMGHGVSPCGGAWGHIGLGRATTVALTTTDATRQIVLMANAMVTSDEAWAALSRATWAVLCSEPPCRPQAPTPMPLR